VAFSSKKTEASATGVPAGSRTVPETTIAGRGSAGACAKVDAGTAEKVRSDMAAAQDRSILVALMRK
jgi:hypothetical protein